KRSCIRTKIPARRTCLSILRIRKRFMRRCGRHVSRLGRFAAERPSLELEADSINPRTAAVLGGSSLRDSLRQMMADSAVWGLRLRLARRIGSMRRSRPGKKLASMGLMMAANPGDWSIAIVELAAEVRVRWASPYRQIIRTSFTLQTQPRGNPAM